MENPKFGNFQLKKVKLIYKYCPTAIEMAFSTKFLLKIKVSYFLECLTADFRYILAKKTKFFFLLIVYALTNKSKYYRDFI